MTDRELLELAANAAFGEFANQTIESGWNPLTDDGDALRLAVKLDFNVFHVANSAYAMPSENDGSNEQQVMYGIIGGDKYKATRIAIVRAAAEIGKDMK